MRQNSGCLIALEAKSAPIITMPCTVYVCTDCIICIYFFIYYFSPDCSQWSFGQSQYMHFSYLSRVLEGFALDVCSLSLNLPFFLHGFVLM